MSKYQFTFGPWNISTGSDPFGPAVRERCTVEQAIALAGKLEFDGMQFHDDEFVSAEANWSTTQKECQRIKALLDDHGLVAEFVAPRLWEDPLYVDGAITSNDPKARQTALRRSKRTIDIARQLGTRKIVLWPAREGTYIRESKNPVTAVERMLEYVNELLRYDKDILILGEMKPNEPMDQAFCPTVGHFLALSYRTEDPSRVGVLIESAHSLLAGLDPSDDMAFALSAGKLWSVHLNDQNGPKFDEDRAFGSVNLRCAFNQVRVLEENNYGDRGEMIGLDVRPMRTQTEEAAYLHLKHSRETFLRLVEMVRALDRQLMQQCIQERNYEALDQYILSLFLA